MYSSIFQSMLHKNVKFFTVSNEKWAQFFYSICEEVNISDNKNKHILQLSKQNFLLLKLHHAEYHLLARNQLGKSKTDVL